MPLDRAVTARIRIAAAASDLRHYSQRMREALLEIEEASIELDEALRSARTRSLEDVA